ncbi:MAG: cob(I)yrinic acid a,c-diamide adenosyltransferase [Parcubacteria group bacterium]|nr:cob(I)yrinic acid a,c-diamide adenosyltransferase [Parcubacteria group bacterium]MCR4342908.1 cob(I)yrinic acid a,c-diamide adenosyltransferase [Patescibacteria group bacterium]
MIYTGKGDDGNTNIFGCCDQRLSKSSAIACALGDLDELNSFLGVCKVKSKENEIIIGKDSCHKIIDNIQQNLFIIQAEVAGGDKKIGEERVKEVEALIASIEEELPPITSFFVSGGAELSSMFDFSRTIARRAERKVVEVKEEGKVEVSSNTLAYLNRLSSLLYAMARIVNHRLGIVEPSPRY